MRTWANIVDALAFVALVSLCGMGMCNAGCGDDPCGGCDPGEICQQAAQKPGDSFLTTRWQCLKVTKEVVRRPLLSTDGANDGGVSTPDLRAE